MGASTSRRRSDPIIVCYDLEANNSIDDVPPGNDLEDEIEPEIEPEIESEEVFTLPSTLESETLLYDGCSQVTLMSAIITLFRFKASSDMSDKSFGELLRMIKSFLPTSNTLPKTTYTPRCC